jgi:hypothetical protein
MVVWVLVSAYFQNNYVFAITVSGIDHLMAVHAAPGWDVVENPGIGADRLYPGARSQLRYTILDPDHG